MFPLDVPKWANSRLAEVSIVRDPVIGSYHWPVHAAGGSDSFFPADILD